MTKERLGCGFIIRGGRGATGTKKCVHRLLRFLEFDRKISFLPGDFYHHQFILRYLLCERRLPTLGTAFFLDRDIISAIPSVSFISVSLWRILLLQQKFIASVLE